MVEIYYWEDDDDAADLLDAIKAKGLECEAIMLDAEDPSARPSVTYNGKTYWEWDDFYPVLKSVQVAG